MWGRRPGVPWTFRPVRHQTRSSWPPLPSQAPTGLVPLIAASHEHIQMRSIHVVGRVFRETGPQPGARTRPPRVQAIEPTSPARLQATFIPPQRKNGHLRSRRARQAPPRVPWTCNYCRAQNGPALPGQACRRYVAPHLLVNWCLLSRSWFDIAEDNLNISLKDITVTQRDGRVSQLDQVYIRGSMVRFFIVPDMLQNAPM